MAWRTVVISNPARLRIDNDRLIIIQESSTPLPLEDIAVLVIESPQVTLSSAVLARLADHGAMVIVCGPSHLPIFAGLPFAGHCRLTAVHRLQLETTLPFRKRCWQRIVQAKIANQAECLRLAGRDGAEAIARMVDSVQSGDTGNVESAAAREYFRKLFRPDFDRRIEYGVNSALNYGYAVIRAAVARSLAAYGFLLTQGIHHCSELNAFNLADDFLEPFRPIVDLCVASLPMFRDLYENNPNESSETPAQLQKAHREQLAQLLACQVRIQGERQSVLQATEITAASFGAACRTGDPKLIKLPELVALREHRYE
ncbi:MAG: type II CRISPR-associated endonuclease Cas1 [Armatimonadetes bacterium]|nr:type II CRISPR-associated endonuclease Cas1 [Armatimonadota bacterium]